MTCGQNKKTATPQTTHYHGFAHCGLFGFPSSERERGVREIIGGKQAFIENMGGLLKRCWKTSEASEQSQIFKICNLTGKELKEGAE